MTIEAKEEDSGKAATVRDKISKRVPTLISWALSLYSLAQYIYFLLRRTFIIFRHENVHFQANALAYRSLISLVPALAFLVSFFTLFKDRIEVDLSLQVQSYLFQYMMPGTGIAESMTDQVQVFIDNAKDVTYVGFLILFITAILLVNTIEQSFNHIWKVEQRRSLTQRLMTFSFVLIWGPALLGMSIYITAKYKVQDVLVQIYDLPLVRHTPITGLLGEMVIFLNEINQFLLPFVLFWLMLTLLYIYLPYTKVEGPAAALSAALAALLWEISKWAFSIFAAYMATSRERIFGSLAVFLVFLLWMYLTWIIILLGTQLSFVIQNYRFVTRVDPKGEAKVPDPFLAVQIMIEITDRHTRNLDLPSVAELAEHFSVSVPRLRKLLLKLVQDRILTRVGGSMDGRSYHTEVYTPSRDLDRITLGMVVDSVGGNYLRASEAIRILSANREPNTQESEQDRIFHDKALDRVKTIFGQVREASFTGLDQINFRDLVVSLRE